MNRLSRKICQYFYHKREDKDETLVIANDLKGKGVLCYVDAFDPVLQTIDDITKTLRERIGLCTHLMAVVSEYTTNSWWVPFEIGVGTEKDRRITSFKLREVYLPEFLTKWPILKNKQYLDVFVQLYKKDTIVAFSESYSTRTIYSADQFHRMLKASI